MSSNTTNAMDKGTEAAKPFVDLTADVDENPSRHEPAGSKLTGTGDSASASAFDAKGSVGKQFTTEGTIGGVAQKIGGPLSETGAIGKQFTDKGSVGGTVQDNLGGNKQ